jgi:hypothetical protein
MGHREDAHYETLDYQTYDPHHLVDSILDHLELDTDEAFARALDVPPAVIDEIRYMKRPVDAELLIRMHELTGLPVSTLRNMLGDRRKKIRCDEIPD